MKEEKIEFSFLASPEPKNLRKPLSSFITPNAPSTCIERFILSSTPNGVLIFFNDSSLCCLNFCDTFIVRCSYFDLWHILIYLAASDSDGSLGGLISIAENASSIENIFDNMLRKALWCSGDPVCINTEDQAIDSLNYSACHDCVLLPEVSCESRNVFLDRVSVIGKPENRDLGLFGIISENLGV